MPVTGMGTCAYIPRVCPKVPETHSNIPELFRMFCAREPVSLTHRSCDGFTFVLKGTYKVQFAIFF